MNLLIDRWIPVRAEGGMGAFRLLTFEELLCREGAWWVSLPRDDLEMACTQLLVCMTQVMLMPREEDPKLANKALLERIKVPLAPEALSDAVAPYCDWFDLNHRKHPFMQARGVRAEKVTPIQKLLIGLPEGNNHAFFNGVGEVRRISGPIAAIALFNQASNTQSLGGGFKGNLRGGSNPYLAPISSLVVGENLRDTVWRNVITLPRIQDLLGRKLDVSRDKPTWIEPIRSNQQSVEIELARGLFWQPARLELVPAEGDASCDVLGGESCPGYSGLLKEQSRFNVEGLWPHPHGGRVRVNGKDKFISFSAETPAWMNLSEFLVPNPWDQDAREGSVPAATISQAAELWPDRRTHLLVGGYCTKISSVIERRHELFSLAEGWTKDRSLIKELVTLGKEARSALRNALLIASKGYEDKKRDLKLKGIGTIHKKDKKLMGLHDVGDRVFFARTETLFNESLGKVQTFKERQLTKSAFSCHIAKICHDIFEEQTDPYAMRPEVIPIIAWARDKLKKDLFSLTGGNKP